MLDRERETTQWLCTPDDTIQCVLKIKIKRNGEGGKKMEKGEKKTVEEDAPPYPPPPSFLFLKADWSVDCTQKRKSTRLGFSKRC